MGLYSVALYLLHVAHTWTLLTVDVEAASAALCRRLLENLGDEKSWFINAIFTGAICVRNYEE